MAEFWKTITLIGVHVIISIVFALLFMPFSKTEKKHLFIVYGVFMLLTTAILFIPNLPVLNNLNWNWQGKFLSFLMALAFMRFLPFLTKKEAGFTFKVNKSVWLPLIILLAISIAYNLYETTLSELDGSKEYLLFEATMPGLSEEPIYRGIILGLLNLIFVSRINFLGASVGWGALIQSVLFGVGHAVYFDENTHLQFALEPFIITFILGTFMTYLKEKGESIIPALIFHNVFNAFPAIVKLFV